MVLIMKRRARTYHWKDGEIEDATFIDIDGEIKVSKPVESIVKPKLDIQNLLLLFTVSTVVMIFAGGALIALITFIAALILG
jgi:hypothetical protein